MDTSRKLAVVDQLAMDTPEGEEEEEEKKSITVTDSFTDSERDTNNPNALIFETKRWF